MNGYTHWIITALDCYCSGYGYRQQYQCAECLSAFMSDPTAYNDAADWDFCPKCGRSILNEEAEIKKFRKNRRVIL